MGSKTIHHMDLETLLAINKEVVGLTREPHEYSSADGRKLTDLVGDVEARADNKDFDEAVAEKASVLVYDIARGQYFRAGNKRTALVAGLAFLSKNGHTIDIENAEFVETVDRVGVAAADLGNLYAVVRRFVSKSKTERRGWERVVKEAVEAHRDFLTQLGA